MQYDMVVYPMFRQDAGLAGRFAVSNCGRDFGECYVIVSAAGNDLLVANGKGRTFQNPKKKNRRHLNISRRTVPDIELLSKGEPVSSNLKLASYIKDYSARGRDPSTSLGMTKREDR